MFASKIVLCRRYYLNHNLGSEEENHEKEKRKKDRKRKEKQIETKEREIKMCADEHKTSNEMKHKKH